MNSIRIAMKSLLSCLLTDLPALPSATQAHGQKEKPIVYEPGEQGQGKQGEQDQEMISIERLPIAPEGIADLFQAPLGLPGIGQNTSLMPEVMGHRARSESLHFTLRIRCDFQLGQ